MREKVHAATRESGEGVLDSQGMLAYRVLQCVGRQGMHEHYEHAVALETQPPGALQAALRHLKYQKLYQML